MSDLTWTEMPEVNPEQPDELVLDFSGEIYRVAPADTFVIGRGNLHMDAGTLCWIYIFWGFGVLFVFVYALLFLANAATVLLSMRRKYVTLATPASSPSQEA